MYTIKENSDHEIIIKNSKFITILIKINNKDEVNIILDQIKKEYPKATHYCYAYKINDYKKASDDGEPSGTAGLPILNILEKENINNVLAIVVRYFGGIKLGAGGLIRAYGKSVKESLNNTQLIKLYEGYLIEISFDYQHQKQIDYILKDSKIIKQEFLELIKYEVLIKKEIIEKLNQSEFDLKILKSCYIE